jgi:hypothetical protein
VGSYASLLTRFHYAYEDKTLKTKNKRPRLTVRSAAEMIGQSKDHMAQLLYDQKYPELGDRKFRTPYYRPAIAGIQGFYRNGKPALTHTRAEVQGLRQPSRRDHINRVLDSFEQSPVAARNLRPIPNRRYYAQVGEVELRLSPDVQAKEGDETKIIYFNCRNEQYSPETAKRLVEIAYWVLRQNGVDIRPDQIEFVDLFTRTVYTVDEVRAKTLETLSAEALEVTKIWQGL